MNKIIILEERNMKFNKESFIKKANLYKHQFNIGSIPLENLSSAAAMLKGGCWTC